LRRTQIAHYFKGYNEHLLFDSANEPNVSAATGMSVLLSYHQTFINAVRATGGNDSSRMLIIQGVLLFRNSGCFGKLNGFCPKNNRIIPQ
jgi:hypothetical protein